MTAAAYLVRRHKVWSAGRAGSWASTVNAKRVERSWRLEGNRVPPAKSKKVGETCRWERRELIWNFPSAHVDHTWTIDFIEDRGRGSAEFPAGLTTAASSSATNSPRDAPARGVTILFIEQASPQQNGFIERFHRSMHSEVLNVEEFDPGRVSRRGEEAARSRPDASD